MKVALIITGRIKKFEESFRSIKQHILDVYNPTVFASIHANGLDDTVTREFARMYNIPLSTDYIVASKYQREHPESSIWNHPVDDSRALRYASMYYHLHNAFELVNNHVLKTGEQFDVVIRWRADLCPCMDLPLPEHLEDDVVYIPYSPPSYDPCPPDWIPDIYAICTFEGMQRYCSVYKNLFPFFETHGIGLVVCEQTLFYHMLFNGMKWTFYSLFKWTGFDDRFDEYTPVANSM